MRRPPSGWQRTVSTLLALCVLVTHLALPPHAQAANAGASAGRVPPPSITAIQSFQPDLFTGRATTSIPIVVPPGRRGLQPSLALTYSSTSRNSWVGVGWDLDVGSIEISTKEGPPTYGAGDVYTLSMQGVSSELVQTGSGAYRLKDEGAFLRILAQSPAGWEVTDKSGTRYFFGVSPTAQVQKNGLIFRWLVEKVLDVDGNSMTLSYVVDEDERYLSQIRYTAHDPSVLPSASQIDFLLQDRADRETSFRPASFGCTLAKRLQQIKVQTTVNGLLTLVRRYDLSYTSSPRTGRSLLQTITQVGSDGVSTLPPVSFTYQGSAMPTYAMAQSDHSSTQVFLTGDVDGSGVSDRISWNPATGLWTVIRNTYLANGNSTEWLRDFGTPDVSPLIGDWDGDGLTDVGLVGNGVWKFALSTGSGFQIDRSRELSFPTTGPITGDFNGDGRIDVANVTPSTGQWQFALASPTGAFVPTTRLTLPSWGAGDEPITGDFNGDGLTDLGIKTPAGDIWTRYATGRGWEAPALRRTGFAKTPTSATDLDGDGLADLVTYDPLTGNILYARCLGLAFEPTNQVLVTFAQPTAQDQFTLADFNGDGLLDPVVFHRATATLVVAQSQGQAADVFSQLTNGIGGTTTLMYQFSAQQTDSKLPFVIPVVQQVTVNDGLGNSYTTRYSYTTGRYADREFRGFGHVEVRDALDTVTATDFLQDAQLKGHPSKTVVWDSTNALWTKTEQTWSSRDVLPGVHFVKLDQSDSFLYDGDATFKQTRQRFTYDDFGNVTQVLDDGQIYPPLVGDERTAVTTYVPNTTTWILGLPSSIKTLDSANVVIAQRRFTYDGAADSWAIPTKGQLTKEEEWLDRPTSQWLATTLSYNASGKVVTVTDALGRVTKSAYDPTGTYVTKLTNALGHTRQWTYDPRWGQPTSTTDPNGVTTATEFDVFGRVTKIIGPTDTSALPSLQSIYDLSTAPTPKTTTCARIMSGKPDQLCTTSFTNGLGQVIQTRALAEDPTQDVVGGAVELNSRGLVAKQWAPYLDTHSTTYVSHTVVPNLAPPAQSTYDPLGRLIKTVAPDGAITTASYNDGVTTVIDANGHATRQTGDAHGQLMLVEEFIGINPLATTYAYDSLGHLLRVIDAKGNTTTLSYDSLGRKLSMTDPDMGSWSYSYDAVDNLTSQTDARNVTTMFLYDELNRLTQKSYTLPLGSTVAATPNVTYTYDDSLKPNTKGRLTKVTSSASISTFEYDLLGRLTKETKSLSGTTYPISRTYDLLGRITSLTYPDGEQATYTYNGQGGLETVNLFGSTSAGAPPTTLPIIQSMAYNAAGQLLQQRAGNGITTDYGYDQTTARLRTLTTKTAGGTKLQDLAYGFDPVGNVTQITDQLAPANTQTFTYDALDRLLQAQGAYGPKAYAYDAIGNLTNKEGVVMSYGVTGTKPHAVTATPTETLSYDANGNLIKRVNKATNTTAATLTYDADNRLVKLVKGTNTFTYAYDGDGGRITATDSTGTTRFLGELYELSPTGVKTKGLFAGDQRVATKEATTLRFLHGDHLGSTSLVSDSTGQVVERVSYLPFGATSQRAGPVNVPQKFTGQRLDSSGLYFYHARYYDPALGRFLSADPTIQRPGDPQDLNRYSYCRNNPINLIDPSGYGWLRKFVAAAVAIVVAIILIVAFPEDPEIGIGIGLATYTAIAGSENPKPAEAAPAPARAPPQRPSLSERWAGFATNPLVAGGASIVASFIPGVSDFYDLAGVVTGIDVLTGQPLTAGQRAFTAVMLAVPFIGAAAFRQGGRALNHVVQDAEDIQRLRRAERVLDETGEDTEIVERAMSRAELKATRKTGLVRGGREGTHYVSDSVNHDALRARQRLSLKQTPEVRAKLEVPKGRFSEPSAVDPMHGMPGGGKQRTGTGKIPARVIDEHDY